VPGAPKDELGRQHSPSPPQCAPDAPHARL